MNAVKVDVLVIGGGPAGTPLAMALAKAGKHVLLAEDGHASAAPVSFMAAYRQRYFVSRPECELSWRGRLSLA